MKVRAVGGFSVQAQRSAVAALLATAIGGAALAQAAPINYGDFSDIPPGSVMYLDVTETANTPGDEEPLFGAPEITGDLLDFDPAGFVATSSGGAFDITDGQLNFTLMAAPGKAVTALFFSEDGDFNLVGAGTSLTGVSADLSVRIDILEVDGVPVASPIVAFGSSRFSTDLTSVAPGLTPWSTALLFDLGPVLAANNIFPRLGVTKAEVVLDNQLISSSESASLAYIAKKDFRIASLIVPEPATVGLLLLGLLLILIRHR